MNTISQLYWETEIVSDMRSTQKNTSSKHLWCASAYSFGLFCFFLPFFCAFFLHIFIVGRLAFFFTQLRVFLFAKLCTGNVSVHLQLGWILPKSKYSNKLVNISKRVLDYLWLALWRSSYLPLAQYPEKCKSIFVTDRYIILIHVLTTRYALWLSFGFLQYTGPPGAAHGVTFWN